MWCKVNRILWENLIIQAAIEIGIENVTDINSSNQMGVIVSPTNVKNNFRVSTAKAYLRPNKERKILHLQTIYFVELIFEVHKFIDVRTRFHNFNSPYYRILQTNAI